MQGLHEKAMLASLSIKQWTARKHDKKISAQVAQEHGVIATGKKTPGNYNKNLIDRDALEAIRQKGTEARTFYYANTLPWTTDGQAILPAANYIDFMTQLDKFRQEYMTLVNDFQDNYPRYVAEQRQFLNGMFNAAEYPTPEQLHRKFDFSVSIAPLPIADDFRVTLGDEEQERIKADIKARTENAISDAMRDLYKRLADCLEKMVEKLSDPKAIFRDTLTGNLSDLVNLLPRLNLTADPQLETIRREIEAKLLYEPETLRKAPAHRQQAAKDAAQILDMMKGYC